MKTVIANWKMNFGVKESLAFLENFKKISLPDNVEIMIAPSFTALSAVSDSLRGTEIKLAAQDVFWQDKGAFTGETAPFMLKELGVTHVIIGHSERRHIIGETDEMIAQKIQAVVAAGLTPSLCVGETLEERNNGMAEKIVNDQLTIGLSKLQTTHYSLQTLTVAYEPVWAIGTGVPCDSKEAAKMHQFIRNLLTTHHQLSTVKVIYGGSVNSDNTIGFVAEKEIDGFLVGGASLDPEKFAAIIKSCQ